MPENKLVEKIKNLNLDPNTPIKLKLSNNRQVFHYTGDYTDEVYKDTNFLYDLSYVVSFEYIRKYNSIINEMRQNNLLDDYERGSFSFDDYIYNLLAENRWDYVQENLEQWDYKRGKLTLEAELEVPAHLLLKALESFMSLDSNWSIFIKTENGILELE